VVFFVKLPHHVVCTFEVQPHQAGSVHVTVPGTLSAIEVRPGDRVEPGQVLARLQDLDVDLRIAELESLQSQQRARLENLAWQLAPRRAGSLELGEVKEALAAVAEQLDERRKEQAQLVLVAPCAAR